LACSAALELAEGLLESLVPRQPDLPNLALRSAQLPVRILQVGERLLHAGNTRLELARGGAGEKRLDRVGCPGEEERNLRLVGDHRLRIAAQSLVEGCPGRSQLVEPGVYLQEAFLRLHGPGHDIRGAGALAPDDAGGPPRKPRHGNDDRREEENAEPEPGSDGQAHLPFLHNPPCSGSEHIPGPSSALPRSKFLRTSAIIRARLHGFCRNAAQPAASAGAA